jgi:MinD-like ATPase involved in chromosome partitioning or flagellar assembly
MNPGVGVAGQDRAELVHRIRTPLRGSHRIAVISVKGGVGKTTVSACLGLTFAGLRADRVLAMDANPDMGTLADRLTGDTDVTVQHLLDHLGAVDAASINDIEQFVSAVGRLHVLAGGQEPCDGQAFTRDEYEEAVAALSDCYNVLITDSGTGVNHSAMEGTIAAADGVVIVGAPTVDAASRASMTLEWLENIGRGELAHNAVVALSLDRTSRDVDRRVVVEHFAPRCRAVVEVPSDPHLATGGRIDLAACRQPTRDAFLVLAAELADAFPAYEW